MKQFYIFCMCFIFAITQISWAQKPSLVFPHPLVPREEVRVSIAQRGISFVEYYLQNHPLADNESLLLTHFEKAQTYYLAKSFDLAALHYKKVAQCLFYDDWKPLHRQALVLSVIRLAELLPQEREHWLEVARSFGSDIDFKNFKISEEFLKPLNSPTESLEWDVTPFRDTFDTILINGREVVLEKIKTVKIPKGNYRLVFLSATYKPHILQVSESQIPLLAPIALPFVTGSCQSPALASELTAQAVLVYPDCTLALRNKTWEIAQEKSFLPKTEAPQASPFLQNSFHREAEPFYKKPWFLATAVAAVSATIYFLIRDQKEKRGASSSSSSTIIGEF